MARYDGSKLRVGDTVAYTRTFVNSTPGGCAWSRSPHDAAQRRGVITKIEGGWLAHVTWKDGGTLSATINVGNICKPRSVAFVEEVNEQPRTL